MHDEPRHKEQASLPRAGNEPVLHARRVVAIPRKVDVEEAVSKITRRMISSEDR